MVCGYCCVVVVALSCVRCAPSSKQCPLSTLAYKSPSTSGQTVSGYSVCTNQTTGRKAQFVEAKL